MKCPPVEELLRYAKGGPETEASSSHIEGCAECTGQVRWMREVIGALYVGKSDKSLSHASAASIAALAEGNRALVSPAEISHVATCGTCLSQLALVAITISDPLVRDEIRAVRPVAISRRSWRVPTLLGGAVAAAAVAAIVLLRPIDLQTPAAATRESVMTTSELRILTHADEVTRGDSVRWTGIAGAHNYQVRIWSTEGSVIFAAETRSNVIAVPSTLSPGIEYLWEVRAQTDWDRWIESDLVSLKIRNR
jgi:hypothetical protein